MINAIVGEANPVGVVEGGHSLERAAELHRIVKVQGMGLDLRGLRRTFGMPRERSHAAAGTQESAGDGPAGIAEGSGDGIDAGVVAAGLRSRSFGGIRIRVAGRAGHHGASSGVRWSGGVCGSVVARGDPPNPSNSAATLWA